MAPEPRRAAPAERLLIAVVAAVAGLALLAACGEDTGGEGERSPGGPPSVTASDTLLRLTGGQAYLRIDRNTLASLRADGVTVSAIPPARLLGGVVTFPIRFGTVHPGTFIGAIDLGSGGLRFTRGGRSYDFRNMTLSTGDGALAASTPGVPLASLDLDRLSAQRDGDIVDAGGMTASLDGGASDLLVRNLGRGVAAFAEGTRLGEISLRATVRPASTD